MRGGDGLELPADPEIQAILTLSLHAILKITCLLPIICHPSELSTL